MITFKSEHRRQPWGDGGMHSPKFTVDDVYITIPPIWMVNWTADKTAACVLLRKQRDMYVFFLHKIPVLHPFTNKYQLGGFVHYTPYWVFAPGPQWVTSGPQNTFPFASIHLLPQKKLPSR